MKIKYNHWAAKILSWFWRGESFITWNGTIYAPGDTVDQKTINHESIHQEQMKELGKIKFLWYYVTDWVIGWFYHWTNTYVMIRMEQEAYDNDQNFKYIITRKPFAWKDYPRK